jgi:hypothetical protein
LRWVTRASEASARFGFFVGFFFFSLSGMKRPGDDEIRNGPSDPDHLLQFRNAKQQNVGGRGKKNEDSFETGAAVGSAWALFSRHDVKGNELTPGLLVLFCSCCCRYYFLFCQVWLVVSCITLTPPMV